MSNPDSEGIAIAAMALHEILIRTLIERGLLHPKEIRAILDNLLLQLETRRASLSHCDQRAIDAQRI